MVDDEDEIVDNEVVIPKLKPKKLVPLFPKIKRIENNDDNNVSNNQNVNIATKSMDTVQVFDSTFVYSSSSEFIDATAELNVNLVEFECKCDKFQNIVIKCCYDYCNTVIHVACANEIESKLKKRNDRCYVCDLCYTINHSKKSNKNKFDFSSKKNQNIFKNSLPTLNALTYMVSSLQTNNKNNNNNNNNNNNESDISLDSIIATVTAMTRDSKAIERFNIAKRYYKKLQLFETHNQEFETFHNNNDMMFALSVHSNENNDNNSVKDGMITGDGS